MKRFWLILLSLGLVMAFSVPAWALDVKFSGSYYAAGMYLDKTDLEKSDASTAHNNSTAFYFQRLRVQTDFIVSPGLKLITRFDAMERAWGAPRSYPDGSFPLFGDSAGTEAENENIAFDWAYIEYASPIGVFTVGYQPDGGWGTVFADNQENGLSVGKIGWAITSGGFTGRIQVAKILELSKTAKFSSTPWSNLTDTDIDKYSADVKYAWNGGEAGLRGFWWRSAALRIVDIMTNVYGVIPYAKAKIGPVTIQAELDYYWGDAIKWEVVGPTNVKLENLGFFLDAVADFKMFYAGGTFAYISGDDDNTTDKLEGGFLTGGVDWNPCLILWNFERTKWAGNLYGVIDSADSPMSNVWFFQVRGGVRPIAALDIMASVSYALADQKFSLFGGPHDENAYGTEVDLTATYKITNNLSYMVGVGYLFTGAYYKGAVGYSYGEVRDDYLLINKLTLTF